MTELTLVIPAKEEPNALPLVLEEIKNLNVKKIIVLKKNDKLTIDAIKEKNCEILFQSGSGYGNAICEGILEVKTKYCAIFYADGSTDPKYLFKMLKEIQDKNLSLIFGSRYMSGAGSYDDDLTTKIGNFFFTMVGNVFFSLKISDLLFTYIVAKTIELKKMQLYSNNYNLCVEIPLKAKFMKMKYISYPCIERKRFADKKKVKAFSDGLKILIYFFKKYLNFINKK